MFRVDPEEAKQSGGIAGFVHNAEVALDRYDATHAHHLSRMEAANALAEDVRTRLERSRASWTELERETSTLSDLTDSTWKLGADVDRSFAASHLREVEKQIVRAVAASNEPVARFHLRDDAVLVVVVRGRGGGRRG